MNPVAPVTKQVMRTPLASGLAVARARTPPSSRASTPEGLHLEKPRAGPLGGPLELVDPGLLCSEHDAGRESSSARPRAPCVATPRQRNLRSQPFPGRDVVKGAERVLEGFHGQ